MTLSQQTYLRSNDVESTSQLRPAKRLQNYVVDDVIL